jgi:quinol---cytochrome-c reductase cytochrome b subunit
VGQFIKAAFRRLVRADPGDRWAAAFGRIAVYSFAVTLVTGLLLLPFFQWLIWVGLLLAGTLAGWSGGILPDDMLSGGSLSVLTGVILSVPVVGTRVATLIFGGSIPGHVIIARDYWLHIAVLPTVLAALLLLSYRGLRPRPVRVRRLDPLLPFTAAALVALGAAAQINPVWLFGPYQPDSISAGAAPDWYLGFLDGALRIMPGWEVSFGGNVLALDVLVPAVVVPASSCSPGRCWRSR